MFEFVSTNYFPGTDAYVSTAHRLEPSGNNFLYTYAKVFSRSDGDDFQSITGPTLITSAYARDTFEAFCRWENPHV